MEKETQDNKLNKSIFIANIPVDATRDEIEDLCNRFGRVLNIQLRRGNKFNNCNVTFMTHEDAEFVIYRVHRKVFKGQELRVNWAEHKESIYTYEEIAKHNKPNDLWVIYKNDVFNISYFNNHPGGPEIILESAGKDITNSFLDIGHSEAARTLMREYHIGKVDLNSKSVFVNPSMVQSDYSKSMNPIEPKFDYNNTEAIDEELKCPICLDPFFEPVVLKCCEHTLCKKCADPCSECPLCRQMHKPFANPPRLIMNMLSRIDVSCQACCAVVKRDSFPSHVQDVCPIPCPNGCGVSQTRATVAKHLDLCSYQIVPCEASIVGCMIVLRRYEMEEHESKCSIFAQKELLLRIQQLEIEVQSQKEIISDLQRNTLSIEFQEELRILAERIFRRKEEKERNERKGKKPKID